MEPEVRLYELAAADGTRFSPFCWRTRWALRHKGVSFQSIAIHFDELARIGGQHRTVPAITREGNVLDNSWHIAEFLDEHYPDRPPLFGCPTAKGTMGFVESFFDKIVHPAILRLVARDVFDRMNERDRTYFRRTREPMLGSSLEDAQATRDEFVLKFRSLIHPVRLTLNKQPWLSGPAAAHADYIGLAAFQWARLATDFPILLAGDPVHEWLQRGLDLFDGFGHQVSPRPGDTILA